MIQGQINRLLKTLHCPHHTDSRRSIYFPNMCQSCAKFARQHLEGILQDWVYCTQDGAICSTAPRTHDHIMINPTELLAQVKNNYYGELLVQVKTNKIYIISKFSAHMDNFLNNVQVVHKANNHKEIYFNNNKKTEPGVPIGMDVFQGTHNSENNGKNIGEIYVKFDINEVNIHLDIANDPQVKVIPSRDNSEVFTFIYVKR